MKEHTLNNLCLEDGLWAIDDGVCRSFLVIGSERALLLDTGSGRGNVRKAAESVTDKTLIVVNSHCHWDHVDGNDLFTDIYIHPLDALNIKSKARLHDVREGDNFGLGGTDLEVLELPGHSYGSIGLLNRQAGYLLSGDLVQNHPLLLHNKITCDISLYLDSLKKVLGLRDTASRIYPSHGSCPLSMDYVAQILSCVEEYFVRGKPSEEYHLMIPNTDVWTRAFYFDGITLVVGPKREF